MHSLFRQSKLLQLRVLSSLCREDGNKNERGRRMTDEEEARKELEDSILEEILKPIMDWLKMVLKGEK